MKTVLAISLAALVAAASVAGCGDLRPGADEDATATAVAEPTLPAVKAGTTVLAEGRVVPVESVTLGFPTSGVVSRVLVQEGQTVRGGQLLARLDSGRQAAAVLQAQADLSAAEAQLALVESGARSQEIAAGEAAVAAAEGAVQAARGSVSAAAANASRVSAGATHEEVAIGERRVEEAKNALWGAQSRRDSICGRVPKYADQADCDGARAAVQQAEEEVRIAELSLQQLRSGPRTEDVTAAAAGVQEARGRLGSAQAGLAEAQANLEGLRAGAADPEVAIARARVDQAQAALEQAYLNLDDTELRAPFGGTVVSLSATPGQSALAGAPVAELADLSAWRIETEDLTELNVVGIDEGDPVDIAIDAIPGLALPGRVARVGQVGKDRLGDIVYTVVIEPLEHEPRLRWNMTAVVTVTTEDEDS